LRRRCAGVGGGAGDYRARTRDVVPHLRLSAQSAYFKCFLFNVWIDVMAHDARVRRFKGRCRRSSAVARTVPGMVRM